MHPGYILAIPVMSIQNEGPASRMETVAHLQITPFGLFPVGEFRGAQGTATKFAGKYTTERLGARM